MPKLIGGFLMVAAMALLLAGCGVQRTLKGQYYLNLGKYEQGVQAFREEVRENPGDAQAQYFLARYLLALDRPAEAEPALLRAVEVAPGEAEFWFWLGVARGVRGNSAGEREAYARVLTLDKAHLQALVYMGHNRIEAQAFAEALKYYDRALALWPKAPEPLFNRALSLKQLGREPEERAALTAYLDLYPGGPQALLAADELNALGDFSYRNHLLGKRRVTLKRICFQPLSATLDKTSLPSLDLVGDVLENNGKLVLHVVAYQHGDPELAKARALAVREHLLDDHPLIDGRRVRASWFGVPEALKVGNTAHHQPEAIQLFATQGM